MTGEVYEYQRAPLAMSWDDDPAGPHMQWPHLRAHAVPVPVPIAYCWEWTIGGLAGRLYYRLYWAHVRLQWPWLSPVAIVCYQINWFLFAP